MKDISILYDPKKGELSINTRKDSLVIRHFLTDTNDLGVGNMTEDDQKRLLKLLANNLI